MIGVKMPGRASQGNGARVGEGLSGLLEATGTLSSVCLPPTCSAAPPPRILPPDEVKVAQSRLTLCDPMDYTVRGILQARILEWVAFPFSRGSSQPRDWTQVSHIGGGFLTSWATREAPLITLLGSPKWGKQETALSVLAVPNQASFVSS